MKLAILDKDGTLIKPKSGAQFVQNPEDQELLPGVKEAIALKTNRQHKQQGLNFWKQQRGEMAQSHRVYRFKI